jgi:hypothetical protein
MEKIGEIEIDGDKEVTMGDIKFVSDDHKKYVSELGATEDFTKIINNEHKKAFQYVISKKMNKNTEDIPTPSLGIFVSRVVPGGKLYYDDLIDHQHEFTQEDNEKLKFVGLPISLAHKSDVLNAGEVVHEWIDKNNGDHNIIATLNRKPESFFANENLISGLFRDVSLQHYFMQVPTSDGIQVLKKPTEISLCKEGRREETNVLLFATRGVTEKDFSTWSLYANKRNFGKYIKDNIIDTNDSKKTKLALDIPNMIKTFYNSSKPTKPTKKLLIIDTKPNPQSNIKRSLINNKDSTSVSLDPNKRLKLSKTKKNILTFVK